MVFQTLVDHQHLEAAFCNTALDVSEFTCEPSKVRMIEIDDIDFYISVLRDHLSNVNNKDVNAKHNIENAKALKKWMKDTKVDIIRISRT